MSALHITILPDTAFNRRMAQGHENRTGHALNARHVSSDGTLWHIVRLCCGDPMPAMVKTWEDMTPPMVTPPQPEPRTWADGHGRWHVITGNGPDKLTRAVDAITAQLHDRGNGLVTLDELREYVTGSIVHTATFEDGTVQFSEYLI